MPEESGKDDFDVLFENAEAEVAEGIFMKPIDGSAEAVESEEAKTVEKAKSAEEAEKAKTKAAEEAAKVKDEKKTEESGEPFYHSEELDLTFKTAEDMKTWAPIGQQHIKDVEADAGSARKIAADTLRENEALRKQMTEMHSTSKPVYEDDPQAYDTWSQNGEKLQQGSNGNRAEEAGAMAANWNQSIFTAFKGRNSHLSDEQAMQVWDKMNESGYGLGQDEFGQARVNGVSSLELVKRELFGDTTQTKAADEAAAKANKSLNKAIDGAPKSEGSANESLAGEELDGEGIIAKYGADSKEYEQYKKEVVKVMANTFG